MNWPKTSATRSNNTSSVNSLPPASETLSARNTGVSRGGTGGDVGGMGRGGWGNGGGTGVGNELKQSTGLQSARCLLPGGTTFQSIR